LEKKLDEKRGGDRDAEQAVQSIQWGEESIQHNAKENLVSWQRRENEAVKVSSGEGRLEKETAEKPMELVFYPSRKRGAPTFQFDKEITTLLLIRGRRP